MKPWTKRILLAASASSVVVLLAMRVFVDPCQNSAFDAFKSPGGRWKVVVFERDCGATTDFSTQASLLPVDSPLPAHAGNVLGIDPDHGKVEVDSQGKIAVKVRFDGDSAVTLAYPASARVLSQITARDGVAVRHERVPADDQGARRSP